MVTKKVLGFIGNNTVDVEMRFDPTAPVEVQFTFDGEVTWIFARELLVVGSTRNTGEGDIRIAPAEGELVRITLDSPFGHADIDVARNDVAAFLNSTFLEFPMHREEEFLSQQLTEWFEREMGTAE